MYARILLTLLLPLFALHGCAVGGAVDPETICDDNLDDDADGEVDCDDSDCSDNAACVLIPERCDDGIDNDEDGRTDCVDSDCNGDPACGDADAEVCGDGRDNDGDGDIDCDDADCAGDRVCLDPDAEICSDQTDNDGDGDVDCDDSDCRNDPDCNVTPDEDCDNGEDDDGDGDTDCDDSDCAAIPECADTPDENCTDGVDNDDDAAVDCQDPDCNDDPACAPQSEDCDDGVDNDGDRQIDCGDTDCADDPACDEPVETICDDNIDNDDDNAIDCGDEDCRNDPACARPELNCTDGQDNDGDNAIDCLDDDCRLDPACRETETACDDGQDNDGDNATDCDDDDCALAPNCREANCTDEIDNDDDNLTDCEDPDCAADANCRVDLCDTAIAIDAEGAFTGTTAGESQYTAGADCDGRGRGPEALYVLTVDANTPVCLDTEGSSFDTVLYVRTVCTDTESQEVCNDDAFDQGLGTRSLVEFNAVAGTEYTIFVDGFLSGGAYTLNVQFAPCTEAVACSDGLDNDGDDDVDCDDSDCADNEDCIESGDECGDGEDNDGDDLIDCADADCAGSEACTETGDECTDNTDNDGDELTDCADPDCANEPACADAQCMQAITIDGPGVYTGDTSDLDNNFRGTCGGNGNEALYTLTVDTDTTICLDTDEADYDTVLYIRTACGDEDSEVDCDDDGGFGTRSEIEFEATAGTQYTVFVDGFTSGGLYSLRVRHDTCATPIPDEVCDSGLDDDLDGQIDCDDSDCTDEPACVAQLCDDATAINAEGTYTAQTEDGVNLFRGSCGGSGNEEIWVLSTTTDTTVCVDTFESGFDTVLYARTDCGDTNSQIACNDDTDGTRSEIEFEATAFTDYFLFADAFTTGFGGDVQMRVRFESCDTPLPE